MFNENRQKQILGEVSRSISCVRREEWKVEVAEGINCRKFHYRTKDDRNGNMVIIILSNGRCRVQVGGFLKRYEKILKNKVRELNEEGAKQ